MPNLKCCKLYLGILGLFTGFSFLSLIESLEILTNIVIILIRHVPSTETLPEHSVQIQQEENEL